MVFELNWLQKNHAIRKQSRRYLHFFVSMLNPPVQAAKELLDTYSNDELGPAIATA